MSNAAATVPAKRSVYHAKTTRVPTVDRNKQLKLSKHTKKQHKLNNADVFVVKHKSNDNENDGVKEPNHKHFDELQESWMTKTKGKPKPGLNKTGPFSLKTAGVPSGKTTGNGSNKTNDGANKSTIRILNIQQYDKLIEERTELLTLNEKYVQRISELEQDTARVLAEFNKLYGDHERLKEKMDTGKDPLIEPYSRVFEDRRILRNAEDGYKKRILRLEMEISEKQIDYDKLQDELKRLKAKFKPNTDKMLLAMKQKEAKLQKDITKLQKDNETLRDKVEELETSEKIKFNKTAVLTYKKPKPKLTIQDEKPQKVKFAYEEKREKFDYEYYLPDSLVYE